jgi:hypothetical protein
VSPAAHLADAPPRTLALTELFATWWELSRAIAEQAIRQDAVVTGLRREFRQHFGIENAGIETLRWYAQLVLEHWSDGECQPFSPPVTDAVLGSIDPHDLFLFDCWRSRDMNRLPRQS